MTKTDVILSIVVGGLFVLVVGGMTHLQATHAEHAPFGAPDHLQQQSR